MAAVIKYSWSFFALEFCDTVGVSSSHSAKILYLSGWLFSQEIVSFNFNNVSVSKFANVNDSHDCWRNLHIPNSLYIYNCFWSYSSSIYIYLSFGVFTIGMWVTEHVKDIIDWFSSMNLFATIFIPALQKVLILSMKPVCPFISIWVATLINQEYELLERT